MDKDQTALKTLKFSQNYTYVMMFAVIAILSGIIVGIFALNSAYEELDNEHHDHLLSLVWSSDRNLDHLFTYCRQELHEEAVQYQTLPIAEFDANFQQSDILQDDKFDVVVLLNNMELENSSDRTVNDLDFPKGYSLSRPCLCTDDNNQSYIAVIERIGREERDIAALLRVDKIFEKFVGHELTDYYWMALYDIENGLCIQDDPTQPFVKNISYEAAMSRNDGIKVLANSEKTGAIQSGEYGFVAKSTDSEKFIITALPTAVNDNRYFTIGLSVPTEHYENILNDIFWRTSICGALIVFGLLVIYIVTRKHRRVNEEMLANIKLLREKNRTMQHLMDTSRELAHQQRLVSIGTIASNINHEFSNLLTPIMGYSMLAMEKVPDNDSELMEYLEKIYMASSKAKTLVARLLKLSRKGSHNEQTALSPDEVLDKIEDILSTALPKNVKVEKDYNCPDRCLMASETQIEQVLINIILNAFYAMKDDGGVLCITTRKNADNVEFRLKDSGPGIDEEAMEHIFEPFYTTKEADQGSGLGLAIVSQLVEAHHGKIEVNSKPGEGSEFIVKFPLYL